MCIQEKHKMTHKPYLTCIQCVHHHYKQNKITTGNYRVLVIYLERQLMKKDLITQTLFKFRYSYNTGYGVSNVCPK